MTAGPGLLDGAIDPALNPHLYGHGEAEEFLAQAYRGGKMHHALLIEGAEGIGKATLAFRFANHILAHPDAATAPAHLAPADPDSPLARQIASGASHDLVHIRRPLDEKTNRLKGVITVPEIQRVNHFFGLTSGTGNWRIVIIDPADDMNRNAANAVLKILEEPPKRTLFIVLSHSPGKLLPTIRSRCQRLRLRPLADADMLRALAGLGIDGGQVTPELLALSEGSVSAALTLIHYGGTEIIATLHGVLKTGGPAQRKMMHKLADALSGRDSEVIFEFFLAHAAAMVRDKARVLAGEGQLGEAERLARLSADLESRVAISIAYNLDRKQTILGLIDEMRLTGAF